jgi:hypothetical protein
VVEEVHWPGDAVVETECDAGVLNPAGRVEEPRAHDPHAGLGGLLHERLERPRGDLRVVVEEDENVALGGLRAGVAAAREVAVLGQGDHTRAIRPGLEEIERVVRRVAVHQHELEAVAEIGAERAVEGVQACLSHGALAVADDYDRGCRPSSARVHGRHWARGGKRADALRARGLHRHERCRA